MTSATCPWFCCDSPGITSQAAVDTNSAQTAAAAVCALFVSTTAWLVIPGESQQNQGHVAEVLQQKQNQPDEAFFDEAADYMMLDNQDIYACLASEF